MKQSNWCKQDNLNNKNRQIGAAPQLTRSTGIIAKKFKNDQSQLHH